MKTRRTSAFDNAAQQALAPLRTAGVAPLSPIPLTVKGRGGWVATLHHEIEGVHFDPTFLTPFDLGTKSLNTVLFQLAANGIRPHQVQVSAGINQGTTEPFLEEIFRGMKKVSDRLNVDAAFGSSVHSPTSFFLSLVVLGKSVTPKARPKVGDKVAITGSLGTAAAGLQCLRKFGWPAVKDHAKAVRAHLCPEPPLAACLDLDLKMITGMTALVDGLSSDLFRLGRERDCGFSIDEENLPVLKEAKEVAGLIGGNLRRWALYGSEDFGLLLTVPGNNLAKLSSIFSKAGTPLTVIGEVRPRAFGVQMRNLEGENVKLLESSWNPIVRRKTR